MAADREIDTAELFITRAIEAEILSHYRSAARRC